MLKYSMFCAVGLVTLCLARPVVAQTSLIEQGSDLNDWPSCRFGAEGEIKLEAGVLHLGIGEPMTGVRYAGDLDLVFGPDWQDYEMTCRAARLEGNDFFLGMTFPVGREGACTLILGGWSGPVVGLSSLDGMDAGENETTQLHSFKEGQWYTTRVRVTAEKIQVWLEGEPIIDVDRGDYKSIQVRPEVEPTVPFGFATFRTHGAVKDLVITRLDDAVSG